ncbi:hypothetical protein RJ639_030991 [Escallonia herrerae]|uniref:Uncharacterized protein n=1 Tax=Escallonia herrerae TaxID=1293975 RepID=A0AA88X6K3_9ASTE|nr:hypothetical protein RJ639_030991 [Escallonia herrerae]
MATLQKFKLLATQCAVAGSPSRSPSSSPVVRLRRRKTLRMLLSRGRRFPPSPDRRGGACDSEVGKELVVRQKLKDLLVSSPPPLEERGSGKEGSVREGNSPGTGGLVGRRGSPRSLRPLSATFRQRLLRRAWRPVLVINVMIM